MKNSSRTYEKIRNRLQEKLTEFVEKHNKATELERAVLKQLQDIKERKFKLVGAITAIKQILEGK